MALTGDLEHLNIFDIIQLLNTTRKSGSFSVKGSRGESRIIFSNGCIVGANHLNGRVRIGTVLVKMKVITLEDLEKALQVQKNAGHDRRPLIATLIKMGKLGREEAAAGLKKLIEMTIVELVGWTEGTFTLDTESIAVSPECSYPISKMEQEISLDAQMVLMDALRIFDERERDRQAGKSLTAEEDFFTDVVPAEISAETEYERSALTADDLGLGDLEHLERKIPQPFSEVEIFDPLEIHRESVRDMLAGFPAEQQEEFVAFLKRSTASIDTRSSRHEGRTNALVFVSGDELITHSVMTVCKDESVLVFTTDKEEELSQSIDRCLGITVLPVVVFDDPKAAPALSGEEIAGLRQRVKDRFPEISVVQLTSLSDFNFALDSFRAGVTTVFPRPSKETGHATFIDDMMAFLDTFNSYVRGLFQKQEPQREPVQETVQEVEQELEQVAVQEIVDVPDNRLLKLKESLSTFKDLSEPSEVSLALLKCVSRIFERAITFIIHQSELTGEKAIGVYGEKDVGPTSATGLEIPLARPCVFSDTVEKGHLFFGESHDEILKAHLYAEIGAPRSPVIMLLPMKSLGRTVTLTYGDFGDQEASAVQNDMLEILANEAGLVLENALYRKHLSRAQKK